MLRIAIIIGSTRPGRKGETVAKWVYEIAQERTDAELELVLQTTIPETEDDWHIGRCSRLGMKRTTLQSKMQRLGIARPQWRRPFGIRRDIGSAASLLTLDPSEVSLPFMEKLHQDRQLALFRPTDPFLEWALQCSYA